jgi:fructose-1-phosphate kinase PfkB-like protein
MKNNGCVRVVLVAFGIFMSRSLNPLPRWEKAVCMSIKKVTILEFAPTADEIWRISKHNRDGYVAHDAENGLVSILDTAHDAKPRPEILAIYAGGKATNVARVMDRLLVDRPEPEIELVTFLPPPQWSMRGMSFNGLDILPSTPSGIYVQCLQIENLNRVKPHFEVVDELEEKGNMQTTRRCIEIIIKDTGTSLNFSPRIVWSQKSADAVLSRLADIIHGTNMLVIAGAPPLWEALDETLTPHNFYARILDLVDSRCAVSIDVRGYYLHECLIAKKPPKFIFMNKDEFYEAVNSWKEMSGRKLSGILVVHDKDGCWVWNDKLPNGDDLFAGSLFFSAPKVAEVHSTIGAGDAMHAGFLSEWLCSEGESDQLARSVIYSQSVAAVSVSNEMATHGVNNIAK